LVYLVQRKYERAEKVILQVLEGRKKTLAVDSVSIMTSIEILGGIYSAQGKFEQAEEMFTQTLVAVQVGPTGPDRHLC
jgi:tetratricopeptide (TPR) repeat protein